MKAKIIFGICLFIIFQTGHLFGFITYVPTNSDGLVINAIGTGNTTGHIVTLTVTNNNDYPVSVMPQIFYIPDRGKYQDYVGRIPHGISIPPGTTTNVNVIGNCANVNAPPVPSGDPMPPIDTWIPVVGDFQAPIIRSPNDIETPVFLITTPPVSRFDPTDFHNIVQSNGFTREGKTEPDLIMTWPGTIIPVGGVFDPKKDPRSYAPVVVAALEAIEIATEIIQTSEEFTTPISNTPAKERESITQQTFWIYCAGITGTPYVKNDFKGKVYEQVEQNMGKTVTSMPRDQKEEVDMGITNFWNTFQATGVQAKVIKNDSPGLEFQTSSTTSHTNKDKCVCGEISMNLNIQVQKMVGRVWEDDGDAFTKALSESTKETISRHPFSNDKHRLILTIENLKTACFCQPAEAIEKAKKELKSMNTTGNETRKAVYQAEEALKKLEKARVKDEEAIRIAKENLERAREPITAKEAEIEALENDKKDCLIGNLEVTVRTNTVIKKDSDNDNYTFNTSGLKFKVKIKYDCLAQEPCKKADKSCEKEYEISFIR